MTCSVANVVIPCIRYIKLLHLIYITFLKLLIFFLLKSNLTNLVLTHVGMIKPTRRKHTQIKSLILTHFFCPQSGIIVFLMNKTRRTFSNYVLIQTKFKLYHFIFQANVNCTFFRFFFFFVCTRCYFALRLNLGFKQVRNASRKLTFNLLLINLLLILWNNVSISLVLNRSSVFKH